jgi:hypothetical protein
VWREPKIWLSRDGENIMRSCFFPAAAAALLAGCEAPATETLLSMAVESEIVVDSLCEDGCGGAQMANAMVEFTAHPLVSQSAQVDLLQYRVTYTFAGAPAEPPPLADDAWGVVRLGSQAPIPFQPAGDAQREWARTSFGLERVAGEATVEMAGYDHNNVTVFISDTFPLIFEDLTDETNPTE